VEAGGDGQAAEGARDQRVTPGGDVHGPSLLEELEHRLGKVSARRGEIKAFSGMGS
jgi:hypothetical protein